ncbi:MAG TPA: hypothetical protein VE758_01570 [Chthoniobacterales bacterium]|jgi:hypothetical protein|nr:hypothetical protein [Chthoniobacterales bacterium]
MRNIPICISLIGIISGWFLTASAVHAARLGSTTSQFTFQDANGTMQTVPVESKYYPNKIISPVAKVDRRLDPRLLRAATLAEERAHAHSREQCWRYVKDALLAAGAVTSRPKTLLAKQAGDELMRNYGFTRLPVSDPYAAPVGAVLVYGAQRAAGHVEIRTRDGFVSDFRSTTPSPRRLLAVYAKLSS